MDNQEKEVKTEVDKQPIIQGMDEVNKKALEVLQTKGEKEFIKHVFTDQSTGKELSYAEMRMRFG